MPVNNGTTVYCDPVFGEPLPLTPIAQLIGQAHFDAATYSCNLVIEVANAVLGQYSVISLGWSWARWDRGLNLALIQTLLSYSALTHCIFIL